MAKQTRILIIDDDEVDREKYKRLLWKISNRQFVVDEAEDASEGFAYLEEKMPDCILLDQKLPDIDGLDFLMQLKKDFPKINCPVIMLTGQGNEQIAAQAIREGVSDYLIKGSVNEDNLARSINASLEKSNLQKHIRKQNIELGRVNIELKREQKELIDLYHTMSHELKTPIAAINTFATVLLEDAKEPLTDKQREYLDFIKESCLQLKLHIDTLLEMSRLDTGKLALHCCQQSIESVVKKAVMDVTSEAEKKGLNISYQIERGLPDVNMDEKRVYQVLTNFLNNAIKFTEKGSVSVNVKKDDEDPNYARISVTDTGVGIPSDKLKKIFVRLFQVSGKSGSMGGLGLGLSICKGLVALHEGKIDVISQEGVGSTFSFLLPFEGPKQQNEFIEK